MPPNGFPPFQVGGPNPERGLIMKLHPLCPSFGGIFRGALFNQTRQRRYISYNKHLVF
jgi:hypothetical protein